MTNATPSPAWLYEDAAAHQARRARYLAEVRAWELRQLDRPCDWGALLALLGTMATPLALLAPYAFMGSGVTPSHVVAGMIATALGGVALTLAGWPLHSRYLAEDPEPRFGD